MLDIFHEKGNKYKKPLSFLFIMFIPISTILIFLLVIKPENIDYRFNKRINDIKNNKSTEVNQELLLSISDSLDELDPVKQYKIGRLYLLQNEANIATSYFIRARFLEKNNFKYFHGLVIALISSGEIEKINIALDLFNEAEDNFPDKAEYYYLYGKIFALINENAKAIEKFKQAKLVFQKNSDAKSVKMVENEIQIILKNIDTKLNSKEARE